MAYNNTTNGLLLSLTFMTNFSFIFVTTSRYADSLLLRDTFLQDMSQIFSIQCFGNTTATYRKVSLSPIQVLADALVHRLLGAIIAASVRDRARRLPGVIPARTRRPADMSLVAHFGPIQTANPQPGPSASCADNSDTPVSPAQCPKPLISCRTRQVAGSGQTTRNYATSGTTTPPIVRDALASIDALFAARRVTTHANARVSLLKIVTPLLAEVWCKALSDCSLLDQYSDVPFGLRNGFKTGVSSSLTTHFIPDNHNSAVNSPQIVNEHISKELALNRYSGPFTVSQLLTLIGPFRTAPLGVVPKPNSDKSRIIQDLSFPRNDSVYSSVNSEINSDDFPCEWGSFAQCYFLVAKALPGTQVAVFDVDSAYRNIPVHPEDQCHFCVSWEGQVYIDHCVAFGSASSAGLFGRVADCFVAIVKYYGAQQVLKWVDDIIFFRYPCNSLAPYHYSYDANLVFDIANKLGLPWSLPKFHDFSTSFTYLGFLWNIPQRTVQLPESKKMKFSDRCTSWLAENKRTLRSAQILLGSLNHCCLIQKSARTRLFHLRSFVARFPPNASPFLSLPIPSPLRTDILWWTSTLSQEFFGCSVASPPPVLPLRIFVDASTSWGIDILINNKWAAFRITAAAFSSSRSIGWAEMVAVELAVSLLCSIHPRNSHFLIHSDNQGVIGAIDSSFSRGATQHSSLSRLSSTLLNHDSFLSTAYIRSADNPADPLSRGILPSIASRISTKVKLDPELVPLLARI